MFGESGCAVSPDEPLACIKEIANIAVEDFVFQWKNKFIVTKNAILFTQKENPRFNG
jgi:hypothetical protein